MIELKKLIRPEDELNKLTAEVEFGDGIIFTIRYVGRAKLRAMAQECTVHKFNKKSKQREPSMDFEKFAKLLASEMVKGWRGMTPRRLAKLMPLRVEEIGDEDLDTEIPFTPENFETVLSNVPELDSFLQDSAMDAELFRATSEDREEAELGNSESTESGT